MVECRRAAEIFRVPASWRATWVLGLLVIPRDAGAIGAIFKFALVSNPFAFRVLGAAATTAELQPFLAQTRRLVDAMAYLGEPFSETERQQLDAAANLTDQAGASRRTPSVCSTRAACSTFASIRRAASRSSVGECPLRCGLVEHGWRAYLVKVRNEAGVTGTLSVESPQARPVYRPGTGLPMAPAVGSSRGHRGPMARARARSAQKPMEPQLSGLDLEYRIVLLYSRDRGRREAQLGAMLGAGTDGHRVSKSGRRAVRHRAVARCDLPRFATSTAGRRWRRS